MRVTLLCDLPSLFEQWLSVPRFAIEGVLPAQGVTVLFGPTGVGKSGLAISTALAIANGEKWAGRQTEEGGVFYIAAEDEIGVHARILAGANMRNNQFLPIAVAGSPNSPLTSSQGREEVAAAIEHHFDALAGRIAVIVVDTVATVFGDGSQDDARDVSAFMNAMHRLAEEHEAAVIVVHHTGKSGPYLRGSQVFEDRADAVWQLSKSSAETRIKLTKMRNGPAGATFAFEIDGIDIDLGDEESNVQIVRNLREISNHSSDTENSAGAKRETDRALMLRLLSNAISGVAAGNSSVPIAEWKSACFAEWDHKSDSTKASTFSKHLSALKERKKITVRGEKVSIRVSGNTGNPTGNSEPDSFRFRPHSPLKGGRAETGNGLSGFDDIELPRSRRAK